MQSDSICCDAQMFATFRKLSQRFVFDRPVSLCMQMNELYLGRKHCHITHTSPCNILRSLSAVKMVISDEKKEKIFFLISAQNIACSRTHNLCFRTNTPNFYYIKVGV